MLALPDTQLASNHHSSPSINRQSTQYSHSLLPYRYHRVPFRKIYPTGLIAVDAFLVVDTKGEENKEDSCCRVDALVDLGATYSILSKETVTSGVLSGGGGVAWESLPASQTVSAGMTGGATHMKEVPLRALRLGDGDNAEGTCAKVPIARVFAADIPQLAAIGLQGGIMLLGLDVLAQFDEVVFCFQERAMYLSKNRVEQ